MSFALMFAALLAAQQAEAPQSQALTLEEGRYVERAEDGAPACQAQDAPSFEWSEGEAGGDPVITFKLDETPRAFTLTQRVGPTLSPGEEAGFMLATGENEAGRELRLVAVVFAAGDVQIQAAYLYNPEFQLVTRVDSSYGVLADGTELRRFTPCN